MITSARKEPEFWSQKTHNISWFYAAIWQFSKDLYRILKINFDKIDHKILFVIKGKSEKVFRLLLYIKL